MDQDRFDSLARALGTRLPRRGLAPLAAALAALGIAGAEAEDGRGPKRRRGKQRAARRTQDAPADRDRTGRPGRDARGGFGAAGRVDAEGKKAGGKNAGAKKKHKKKVPKKKGAGGRGTCVSCAAACRVCDFDSAACSGGCGGEACAASDRACTAVQGGDRRVLLDYLTGLGYAPAGLPRATVAREGGALGSVVIEADYARPEGDITALLRSAISSAGQSLSVALVFVGGRVSHANYVGESGGIERLDPDDVEPPAVAAGNRARAAAVEIPECTWCRNICAKGGMTALCSAAGSGCEKLAFLNKTGLPGAVKFAACGLVLALACNEVSEVDCDLLCGVLGCYCRGERCGVNLGICCEHAKCQRCKDGRTCVGCEDDQYCLIEPSVRPTLYTCSACPTCESLGNPCGIFDPPGGVAPGTPACPKLFCGGACPGEGENRRCENFECVCPANRCRTGPGLECGRVSDGCGGFMECGTCRYLGARCQDGNCVSCLPKTCEEAGIPCGLADDGCGGTLNCGPCQWAGTVTYERRYAHDARQVLANGNTVGQKIDTTWKAAWSLAGTQAELTLDYDHYFEDWSQDVYECQLYAGTDRAGSGSRSWTFDTDTEAGNAVYCDDRAGVEQCWFASPDEYVDVAAPGTEESYTCRDPRTTRPTDPATLTVGLTSVGAHAVELSARGEGSGFEGSRTWESASGEYWHHATWSLAPSLYQGG